MFCVFWLSIRKDKFPSTLLEEGLHYFAFTLEDILKLLNEEEIKEFVTRSIFIFIFNSIFDIEIVQKVNKNILFFPPWILCCQL